MSKYDDWTSIELAEAMVDSIEAFQDDSPEDLMNEWDRSDMIQELVDEHGDGLD
jgi:hypothetical protein